MLAKQAKSSFAHDVWAFGMFMFEVLDGDALFEDAESVRECCAGYDATYVLG